MKQYQCRGWWHGWRRLQPTVLPTLQPSPIPTPQPSHTLTLVFSLLPWARAATTKPDPLRWWRSFTAFFTPWRDMETKVAMAAHPRAGSGGRREPTPRSASGHHTLESWKHGCVAERIFERIFQSVEIKILNRKSEIGKSKCRMGCTWGHAWGALGNHTAVYVTQDSGLRAQPRPPRPSNAGRRHLSRAGGVYDPAGDSPAGDSSAGDSPAGDSPAGVTLLLFLPSLTDVGTQNLSWRRPSPPRQEMVPRQHASSAPRFVPPFHFRFRFPPSPRPSLASMYPPAAADSVGTLALALAFAFAFAFAFACGGAGGGGASGGGGAPNIVPGAPPTHAPIGGNGGMPNGIPSLTVNAAQSIGRGTAVRGGGGGGGSGTPESAAAACTSAMTPDDGGGGSDMPAPAAAASAAFSMASRRRFLLTSYDADVDAMACVYRCVCVCVCVCIYVE